MSTLVIVSNLGFEISLGYLAQKYANNVDVRISSPKELRTPQTGLEKYNRVIFCGDWDDEFCSDAIASGVEEAMIIRFEPQTSPTRRLLSILGTTELNPLMMRLLDLLDENIIKLRCNPEIQYLPIGLLNYSPQTTYQALEQLIRHPENLDDVLLSGKRIYSSQIQMVRNRVELNSRTYTFPDFTDVKCAIAPASEFIDLTHEAIHSKYPDVSVSIVVSFSFNGGDQIRYSLRSYDETDVQNIAKKYGGGGTQVSAGFGISAVL